MTGPRRAKRPSSDRLSGARRKVVAAEWSALFPQLGETLVAGTPCFVRRIGPLVQGVILERSSDAVKYRVSSFVHFLGREFPTLALQLRTVATRSDGSDIFLIVRDHPEGIANVADLIRKQSPLPFSSVPTLTQIAGAYRRHIEADPTSLAAVPATEDLVLIPAAARQEKLAADGLTLARRLLPSWPVDRLPNGSHWLDQLKQQAADPDTLLATAEREAERHQLTHLPTSELS